VESSKTNLKLARNSSIEIAVGLNPDEKINSVFHSFGSIILWKERI
jgi:hypothetical protein